jgi:hypothetical protein
MDELKLEISEQITAFVKGGFHDMEEISENIQDMFYDEELDEKWIEKEISKQYKAQKLIQKKWDKETDFDRLCKVFDKLNASGIIALHNAGYTRQDGESDTLEIYKELKRKNIEGYCFYHTQDMDRVIEGENLFLAFGDFKNDDKLGIEIGKSIVAALQEEKFNTIWDESIETRIEVNNITWQKRFENDNCSTERVMFKLAKRPKI